ncbi:MAG: flavodoxin family protein [Candidatus Hodarchaeota archaeon]
MVKKSYFNVLGIVGSPRRGGNTEVLVDEVLKGAEEAGARIEKVLLNQLNIKPCQACDSCYKTGHCVQDDDMIDLFEKMDHSKIWILGTPIYWWGPTAQFKAFLDRWYSPQHQNFKGKKKVILVIPFEGAHPKYARHTVGMLTDVLEYLSMELLETIIAPGVLQRGEVKKDALMLTNARNAGQTAINSLKNGELKIRNEN